MRRPIKALSSRSARAIRQSIDTTPCKRAVNGLGKPGDNRLGILRRRCLSPQIAREYSVLLERLIDRLANTLREFTLSYMIEHHACREKEGRRIGDALSGDIGRGTVHRLEDRRVGADVGAWCQSKAADQSRHFIGQDVAEEIRRQQDIELPR